MRLTRRALGTALVGVLALAGCSTPATTGVLPRPTVTVSPAAAPTHSTAAPRPVKATWVLGARPLPLTAQGYGEVLPTPAALRDRRLQGTDVLAPPPGGVFTSSVSPLSAAVIDRMGASYTAGCPVPLSRLDYLTVTFEGFDGRPHTGELVVAASVAQQVVGIFQTLYAQRFPIEQMTLPTTADVTAHPTGDGNDTAGFVCRAARGQTRFSAHAYGLAIDVNPFENPYSKGDLVLPELASAYLDRSWVRPGMMLTGSPQVRAFTDAGWTWGGSWHSLKDRMHFSLTGD